MKKFFRLFFGRLFWIGLIIFVELAAIILLSIFFNEILEILSIYFYFAGSILLVLLDVIVMIYIINSKANSSYKITWLFIVGLFSFIGVVIYLMFGNKNTTKRMRKKIGPIVNATRQIPTSPRINEELSKDSDSLDALKIANYIQNSSGSPIYDHTETTFFKTGEEFWPVVLEELKKAKHYIFIEYFIIEKGEFFDSILNILKEKAKEGVDVRLMYDDVGSISTLPTSFPKKMEKYGIKCVSYNRFKPFINVKINNRDHRKILVIDGYIGFTGGLNLADEYVNKIVRFGYWKDNAIMLKGRGVYGLTMLFLQNWVANKGGYQELSDEKYNFSYYYHTSTIESDGYIQPYGDIPYDDEAVAESLYLRLISIARKYIYITTPYLIPTEAMEMALCNAAKGGVEVHIVTPGIPDKKAVFNITRSYYDKLIKAGVHIHEYTPGFIHEKMFIVDDKYATIGTINVDYRSLYLNLENAVFLYKAKTILDMKEDFEETMRVSEEITLERYNKIRRHRKIIWGVLRIFAPMM